MAKKSKRCFYCWKQSPPVLRKAIGAVQWDDLKLRDVCSDHYKMVEQTQYEINQLVKGVQA